MTAEAAAVATTADLFSFSADETDVPASAFAASSYFSGLGSDLQTQKQEPDQFVSADLFQAEPFEQPPPPPQPEVQLVEEQLQQQPEQLQQQLQPSDETIAWYQSELVK